MLRYVRLSVSFARYGLVREMTFRGNFVARVAVEVLWFVLMMAFYATVFARTTSVAGWSEPEYFFFIGCYWALSGTIESVFLNNCSEFSELVRSGDLDVYLLRPVDEQFLITCRDVDWANVPNVFMGVGLMTLALARLDWPVDVIKVGLFSALFLSGLAIAYSLLLMMTSLSVWMLRNQNLYELWWLFTSVMRYPREVFTGSWAGPLGVFFTVVVPIVLVVNVPASVMVRAFEPWAAGYAVFAAVVLLTLSRRFFRYALQKYRSASS